MGRQPPAPPSTRFGRPAALQAAAGPARPALRVPPPPVRFGPAAAALQGKSGGSARPAPLPPPTRYGPPIATQRQLAPAPGRPVERGARPAPPPLATGRTVQREMLRQGGFQRYMNLAENRVRGNGNNGFTPPWINDTIWQAGFNQDWVETALKTPTIQVAPDGEGFAASVTAVPTNHVGYRMSLPMPGPWVAKGNKNRLMGMAGIPMDELFGADVEVKVRVVGVGGDEKLEKKIEAHESVHARDIMSAFDRILAPWDKVLTAMLKGGQRFRGATPEAAVAALYKAAGGTPAEIGARLDREFIDNDRNFHASPKGKTKPGIATYDEATDMITIPMDLTIY